MAEIVDPIQDMCAPREHIFDFIGGVTNSQIGEICFVISKAIWADAVLRNKIDVVISNLNIEKKNITPPKKRKKKLELKLKISYWKEMKSGWAAEFESYKKRVLLKSNLDGILSDLGICVHDRSVMKLTSNMLTISQIECDLCSKPFFKDCIFFKGDVFWGCLGCQSFSCVKCCPLSESNAVTSIGICGHCEKAILPKFQCPCGKLYCCRSHQKKNWVWHRFSCASKLTFID